MIIERNIVLQISPRTFYEWYGRYREYDYDGLANNRKSSPCMFWNKIPEPIRQQVVDIALDQTDKSPRELAWHITDTQGYFISESSVYRILKSYDLISSPHHIVMSARDKFQHPTRAVNELWQTDFSYLKVCGWGWYYLSTVMDDYSRYIISWRLYSKMSTDDVKQTLDPALSRTGIDQVRIFQKPRLLSHNGFCYISENLKEYLDHRGLEHTRTAPYHPQTQGKIEHYHRSMKNVNKLQNYYLPSELEHEIEQLVEYYNNQRYHESLNNITPADMYHGKDKRIQSKRKRIKRETLNLRKYHNLRHYQVV